MSATVRTVFGMSSFAAARLDRDGSRRDSGREIHLGNPPHLTCSPIGWRPVKMEVRLDRRATDVL
jgi:hypothetical protein